MADRVSLFVGSLIEQWQEWFGPKAEYLGQQIGVDQHVLNVFVDEVLRGSILFGVSSLVSPTESLYYSFPYNRKLHPHLLTSLPDQYNSKTARTKITRSCSSATMADDQYCTTSPGTTSES